MIDKSLKESILFIITVIVGFSPAAAAILLCGEFGDVFFQKLIVIRVIVALIICIIAYVGIVDTFEVSKRLKPTRAARVIVTGLVTGMAFFQVLALVIGSTCFEYSWLLPIPGI